MVVGAAGRGAAWRAKAVGRRRYGAAVANGALRWVNLAVKALLVALLAFGAFSGLQQFDGKAFGWRLASYPIATLVVPAVWALRGRRPPYPHLLDTLLAAPFLVDVLGNALDLYDTIDWWDDANHFVNWALLGLAIGEGLRRTALGRPAAFGLVVGAGALLAVLWEIAEYLTFIRGSDEERTAYTDTLGDEILGTAGATLAALVTVWLMRRRGTGPTSSPERGTDAVGAPR